MRKVLCDRCGTEIKEERNVHFITLDVRGPIPTSRAYAYALNAQTETKFEVCAICMRSIANAIYDYEGEA